MKKTVNFIAILILISAAGFSNVINLFTSENPVNTLDFSMVTVPKHDVSHSDFFIESIVRSDFKELTMDAGCSLQGHRFDFTTSASYMPTFFNYIQAGLGINYHFYRYFQIFSENDFIISGDIKTCRNRIFDCEIGAGFALKYAVIDSIQKFVPGFLDYSLWLGFRADWKFTPNFDFYFSVKTTDYFDYPLLGTPFFKLGTNWRLLENFALNTELTIKMVDIITSAVYINECAFRTTFRTYF